MVSVLETVITNHRAALLASEAKATGQVLAAYAETRARLIAQIDQLAAHLETTGTLTPGELARDTRARALLGQVNEEMARLGGYTNGVVTNGQRAAVDLAGRQSVASAVASAVSAGNERLAAQIATSWNRLNPGAVEAMVGRLSDGSPLNEWLGQFGDETAAAIKRELQTAIALGTNPRATAARLAGQVDVAGSRLLATARTAQLGAYRDASRINYMKNADVLNGVMRLSANSSRTCPACLALSGTTYPLDHRLEEHVSGRCTLIPIVKWIPPPQFETGEQWLAKQDQATQDQVLGISGGRAYRNGEVELRDFVRRDEDPRWGASSRNGGIGWARANAAKRGVPQPSAARSTARPAGRPATKPSAVVPASKPATTRASSGTIPRPTQSTIPATPARLDAVESQAPVGRTTLSKPITNDESFSLADYGSFGHKQINRALRDNIPELVDTELRDGLDSLIAKSTLTNDTVVYRGMTGRPFGNLSTSVGNPFTDAGYVSTSTSKSVASTFARTNDDGVLVRILVPKGSKAFDVESTTPDALEAENEILLPRGSSFRVTGYRPDTFPPELDLEML